MPISTEGEGEGEVEAPGPEVVLVLPTIGVEAPSVGFAVESVVDIRLEVIPLKVGPGVDTLDDDEARIYK